MGPIELQGRDDVEPLCPYCDKELHVVWMRILAGVLGKRYVYFCPHCRKTLGISHRKGFWMG